MNNSSGTPPTYPSSPSTSQPVDAVTEQPLADRQERSTPNALSVTRTTLIIFSILTLISLGMLVYGQLTDPSKVRPGNTFLFFLLTLFSAISFVLVRRGRSYLGILILVLAEILLTPLFPLVGFISGLVVGPALLASTTWIATVTVRRHVSAGWTVALGAIAGSIAVLLDLYVPDTAQGLFGSINAVLGALLTVVFVYFITRQFSNYPLRTKLIIAFVVIVVVPVAMLGVMNNMQRVELLEEETQQELYETARDASVSIDAFLSEQLDALRTESQQSVLLEYLSLPPDQRPGSPQETQARRALRTWLLKDQIYISSYALLDQNGLDVLDTYAQDIGLDKSDRDYFTEALRTGLPYISSVHYSPTVENLPALYISSPVRSDSGELLGVLRVRYNALILQELMVNASRREVLENMFTVLIDDQDYIRLAHSSDVSQVFKTYAPLDAARLQELQAAGRMPPGSADELSSNSPEMVTALQNIDQIPFFTAPAAALGGELAVSYAVRLNEMPWIVIARQSSFLVQQPVQMQTRGATILTMLAAAFAVLVGILFSQFLTRPIARLADASRRMAAGDLTFRVEVVSRDEIGQLAGVFNEVAAQLQDTLTGLERRVAERTRALDVSAQVSRRLSTILDPSRLVSEVVTQLQAAFDYYHVHIYLFDEARQNLVMVGGSGTVGQKLLESGHSIVAGRGLVGRAAETGMVVLVSDTSQNPSWLPNPLLPDTKSECAVPIIGVMPTGEQVLGVLDVQQNIVGGLNEQDADLLLSIASQVAVALRNASQFSEAQRRASTETLTNEIVQRIQSTHTIEDALQIAARELGRAVEAPRTRVRLRLSSMQAQPPADEIDRGGVSHEQN